MKGIRIAYISAERKLRSGSYCYLQAPVVTLEAKSLQVRIIKLLVQNIASMLSMLADPLAFCV